MGRKERFRKWPMKEPEIFQALLKRYPPPSYALFPQVPSGTGALYARTADAIAFGLWPSRGFTIEGFEIKSNRNDWLNELKQPEKADKIARYCHYWWIVAATEEVAKIHELPKPWGLMVLKKNGLRIKKPVELLDADALDPAFVAGIMRRAQRVLLDQDALAAAEAVGYERGIKWQKDNEDYSHRETNRHNQELKQAIKEFEEKSGVKISTWATANIGEAVKRILKKDDIVRELTWAKNEAEAALGHLNAALNGSPKGSSRASE